MTVLDQWGGSPQSTVEVFKTGDNTTWDSEDPPTPAVRCMSSLRAPAPTGD